MLVKLAMHNFKKQFGQNFLRTDRFAQQLVDSLQLNPDCTVIEIGPGDGRVTNLLLQTGAKVICIEVDYSLIPKLIARFRDYPNFELVHQDVLSVSIPSILAEYSTNPEAYYATGSLPYNISKKIIENFLELPNPPAKMSFIVQEEVAKSYAAEPPKATFLSSWTKSQAEVKKLVSIPNTQFFPVPKVNGAILQIVPNRIEMSTLQSLHRLLRLGFTNPRKTLWNNLSSVWHDNKSELQAVWRNLSLSPNLRAAEVSQDLWHNLDRELTKHNIK